MLIPVQRRLGSAVSVTIKIQARGALKYSSEIKRDFPNPQKAMEFIRHIEAEAKKA